LRHITENGLSFWGETPPQTEANNVLLPPIASDLMSVPDSGYDGTQWKAKLADKPGLNPLIGEFYFLWWARLSKNPNFSCTFFVVVLLRIGV
jgi:hypothetical protein